MCLLGDENKKVAHKSIVDSDVAWRGVALLGGVWCVGVFNVVWYGVCTSWKCAVI